MNKQEIYDYLHSRHIWHEITAQKSDASFKLCDRRGAEHYLGIVCGSRIPFWTSK